MDESSIATSGSHLSAAGLTLQLADDIQLRSLYTNTRPQMYNSLILGRDRNTNGYISGFKGDSNERSRDKVNRQDGDDAKDDNILNSENDEKVNKDNSSTINEKKKIDDDHHSSEKNSDQKNVNNSPPHFSRIFKLDLSGNMLRCQAGAIGDHMTENVYVYFSKLIFDFLVSLFIQMLS